MSNNFINDLAVGQAAEKQFAEVAVTQLGATNVIYNTSSDKEELKRWDLKYTNKNGIEISFEVKHDIRSTETGNFCIEYFWNDKPSGLTSTTANYWVIKSGVKFYVFNTAALRNYIKVNNCRSIQILNGLGWVYLIKIVDIKSLAIKILNIL